MTKLTFFPLGNADTTLVELKDGRRMLVDFADMRSTQAGDKRCDLPTFLRQDLKEAKRKDYAVVAFTHLDVDHTKGASEFFHLDHAKAYQGDGRPKIETMWVPADVVTETDLADDARMIRQEARHRLRRGSGIKVFSRPERLRWWFEKEGIRIEDRAHCIVDAGQLVGGFSLAADGVEFFVHSPHATRSDRNELEDRNGGSLVFQARFREGTYDTDVLFAADVDHEVIAEIVRITRYHDNDDRLHWNVYKLPHHCSYTAVGPVKGVDLTEPTTEIEWLCEDQGERNGFIVAPSCPIPAKGTAADVNVQPPHRQAAEYYRSRVLAQRANLLVTMEEPRIAAPEPIEIAITGRGALRERAGSGGAKAAAAAVAPRAGAWRRTR